jgi:hypothetical protein
MLSVPLCKGKNEQQKIDDVKISYHEDWVRQHLHSIRSAYGRSPYFEFYYPDVEKLFSKNNKYLFDLNVDSLLLSCKFLGIGNEIGYTSSFQTDEVEESLHQSERHSDVPTDVTFVNYTQVWQEKYNFTPNLSILDLLFCTGPEALSILKRMV